MRTEISMPFYGCMSSCRAFTFFPDRVEPKFCLCSDVSNSALLRLVALRVQALKSFKWQMEVIQQNSCCYHHCPSDGTQFWDSLMEKQVVCCHVTLTLWHMTGLWSAPWLQATAVSILWQKLQWIKWWHRSLSTTSATGRETSMCCWNFQPW